MTSFIGNLTSEIACEALRAAGLSCSPDEIYCVGTGC